MHDFRLTPAYCLFNGAAVLEQNGSEIIFLVENLDDVVLQGRLKRAFEAYLETVKQMEEVSDVYKKQPEIRFVKGSREQLRKCVSGLYQICNTDSTYSRKNIEKRQKEAAAILLLDNILLEARNKNATDIHIKGNKVAYRICGNLIPQAELQKERSDELIQRIKLLAGMSVIEKRLSQDGRFSYGNNKPLFIRVSTVAVVDENGEEEESVVLRILDTSRIPLSLNLLGFNENQLQELFMLENLRNGLVLVCGPTGSGKSTTVASMLVEIEKRAFGKLKIISLEDPPEYVIPGVCQVNIDESRGNSFGEILNHVFRQDPDVIMIGEIRDEVSASAALRAALTGHLVFATVHTGSPGEAVLRLTNLGLEKNIVCSVLRGVICQEISFVDNQVSLCADVSIPMRGFGSKVMERDTEEQIDELFEHFTNYPEFLNKKLQSLNRNMDFESLFAKRKRIWGGKEIGQGIRKRIG